MCALQVWRSAVMIALGLLLAASPTSTRRLHQPQPAIAEVKIDNFSFGPATLTVPSEQR